MKRRSVRTSAMAASVAVVAMFLAACSSSGGSGTKSPVPVKSTAQGGASNAPAAAKCDAVPFYGPIVRCNNFDTQIWPVIEASMNKLYTQAKATNGGKIDVWDWYPIPQNQIDAFTKLYPGLSISTRGLQYNLASAIITAHTTGGENSDIVKGSITTMTQLYDQGYWNKVDWMQFGVPQQFVQLGGADSGLLPDSIQAASIQYNSNEVKSVPSNLEDFLQPQWKGKLVTTSFGGAYAFAGYGMTHGQDAMVSLIQKLRSSGNLTVSNNASTLLSSGDKPVYLDTDLTDTNPALKVSPIENEEMFVQFIGVNKYGKNTPGAELFALWEAYSPQWNAKVVSGALPGAITPYPGLQGSLFDNITGPMKENFASLTQAVKDNSVTLETFQNRDKLNTLISAASKALS